MDPLGKRVLISEPEIFICSLFLFLSSVLLWLGSTTIVNLEKKDRSATFTITILTLASVLFGFFSWIGQSGLLNVSGNPAIYFFPGIFCLILIPFGWYFIVIWFLGFLGKKIYKTILILLIFSQLIAVISLSIWSQKFHFHTSLFYFWNFVPFSFRLSYLIYIFVCILVPVLALYSYRISKNILPEVARIKAVPYLKVISFLLFGVFILVFLLFVGGSLGILKDPVLQSDNNPIPFYGILIGIQCFVGAAILVLGKALISYEIFTGRILPKISLRKEWRNAVLGFSIFSTIYLLSALTGIKKIELFLTASLVYILSRTLLLQKNKNLRIEGNAVLRSILTSDEISVNFSGDFQNIKERFQKPFYTLCSEILETSKAVFINESRIPFITDLSLQYPNGAGDTLQITFNSLHVLFENEEIVYLNEESFDGYVLCIKTQDDQSGVGFLLLGPKIDGGLYAEEEIEIAKATSSWILHSLFVESNSQTLSSLQRKHMEEQRILDYKTRQILHDEILPEIHSSILTLSQERNEQNIAEQVQILTNLHKKVSGFLRELPDTGLEIQRLGLIESLIRLTSSEFDSSWFDWNYDPGLKIRFPITKPETLEILFYACRESIRNAVRYSRDENRKKISVSFEEKNGIRIRIQNRIEKNRTPSLESAGQGLKIHSALLKIFGGFLTLDFLNVDEALVEIYLPDSRINDP
ncbi:ATP-binding protein [Leptospira sp. WS92.C1]